MRKSSAYRDEPVRDVCSQHQESAGGEIKNMLQGVGGDFWYDNHARDSVVFDLGTSGDTGNVAGNIALRFLCYSTCSKYFYGTG